MDHSVHAGASSGQIEEAQRQIEQALQTADCQIEALKARVTKKNAQLSDAKLQLHHIREDMQDFALSQRHAPPSLPDTESSEQTGKALLHLCELCTDRTNRLSACKLERFNPYTATAALDACSLTLLPVLFAAG